MRYWSVVFLLVFFRGVFGQSGFYCSPGISFCYPVLESYNSSVRASNGINKGYGILGSLKQMPFALNPELEAGMGLRVDPYISSINIKAGIISAYSGVSSARWPSGQLAQEIESNLSAFNFSLGIKRFGEPFMEMFRSYFGVDAGGIVPVSPFIKEKIYEDTGELKYDTRKEWEGIIPLISAETGIEARFNQGFAVSLRLGYRYARGQVGIEINDRVSGISYKKPDMLDYSGAFATLQFVIGNFQTDEAGIFESGNYEYQALADNSFNEAVSLFNRGLFSAAKMRFQECLKVAPDNAGIKDYLHRINLITNPGGAAVNTQQLLKEACALEEQGKNSEAYFKYQEIIRYEPFNEQAKTRIYSLTQSAKVFYEKALDFKEKGEIKKAVKELKKACEFHPDNGVYSGYLNEICKREENRKKADSLYDEGVDSFKAEDFALALKLWQEAEVLMPEDNQIKKAVEKAKEKLEQRKEMKKQEAVRVLKEAAELNAQGKLEEAKAAYEHVLRLDPGCKEAAEYLKSQINQDLEKEDFLKKRN